MISVALNLLAAALFTGLGYLLKLVWEWYRGLRLRHIYGSPTDFLLMYGELTLSRDLPSVIERSGIPQAATLATRPLVKMDQDGKPVVEDRHFRAEHSACVCDVRAASYLSSSLARTKRIKTTIVGDATFRTPLNTNSISFGTMTNFRTRDLLDKNPFVQFSNYRFVSKLTGKPLHGAGSEESGKEVDYGAIICIRTGMSEDLTWIACAGARQYGTSGAAYVLAHHSPEILRQLKRHTGSFISLVRVEKQRDVEAELMWTIERVEDLKQHEVEP